MPRKSPYTIELSDEEREILEARARRYTCAYRDVVRAQMVLLAAQGLGNDEIARRLNTRRGVVSMWRKRFFDERLCGLEERPRGGRPSAFPALRISLGMGCEDWGCWWADCAPVDAAGVQQDPQSVVGEAPEAVACALDLLDEEVQAFGRPVRRAGAVMVCDLLAPARQCPTEGSDLLDPVGAAPLDRLLDEQLGFGGVVGEVDVPDGFFRAPCPLDVAVGVADA